MANMSYCRFENTYKDLIDCYNAMSNINKEDLSESELKYYNKLIVICEKIADEFKEDDN